jgi:hypothetical protein
MHAAPALFGAEEQHADWAALIKRILRGRIAGRIGSLNDGCLIRGVGGDAERGNAEAG